MASRKLSPMEAPWILVVALLWLCFLQQRTFAAAPQFDNTPYVTTLYEFESQTKTLLPLPCSDADSDPTFVSMPQSGAVTPSVPCGNCFSVLPCTSPATGYCLLYQAGVGSLSTTSAQYVVNVLCTAGSDTVSETVTVLLTRNSPPYFNPNQFVDTLTVSNTKNVNAGETIYDVDAVDDDNDNIVYTMTTDPASSAFEIGMGNGIIKTTKALKSECLDFITFYVTITDGINDPVGPLAVHATLDGSNQKPDLTNLDVTLHVPEDIGKTVIHTLQATDDDSLNKLTYSVTANPASNSAYYGLNGGCRQSVMDLFRL
ncbi:uncharacterized protein LOC143276811 [Babylonia areolata]|uniref:uncharacterized protein LOC143276811 n=1 Tax=Babylonia areolata TaxID=304850 RepID=UPI003FD29740